VGGHKLGYTSWRGYKLVVLHKLEYKGWLCYFCPWVQWGVTAE